MKVLIFLLLIVPSFALDGYITGNLIAEQGRFPYQVLLESEKDASSILCGGSLISLEWILTAASCTNDYNQIFVTLGTIYMNGTGGFKVEAARHFTHEDYDADTHKNNIALVRIDLSNLDYDQNSLRPMKLPEYSENPSSYQEKIAVVAGWGTADANETRSDILKYVYVTVISNEKCKERYDEEIEITDSMLCMGKGPKGICFGDAGSPLILVNSDIIIGVAIYHDPKSCTKGFAGFTRVTSYLNWIKGLTSITAES